MQISITLEGAKELEKKLKNMEPKLAKKIVRQSLRRAAKPILTRAKSLVPVRTGALKKSLKIRAMKRKKHRYGIMVITGQGWYEGEQYYGAFVEFGTQNRPAYPFLRPAFDAEKKKAENILKSEIKSALERKN